ncbi:MAG: hypothetical protein AB1632_14955 [Nitrospirota bacterium]
MERSLEIITESDLRRLLELSRKDISEFFARNSRYKKEYENSELLVALCQGAALHYIDKKNGVKDFDIWYFYPQKQITLPYRRRGVVDFGVSKFGKRENMTGFAGRSVDVLMRSDASFNKGDPVACVQSYLTTAKTKTAKLLSQKAVIGLYPGSVFGKVLWNYSSNQPRNRTREKTRAG